jgi:methylated-DNA-[protein]-cysteine S-methyltransferase
MTKLYIATLLSPVGHVSLVEDDEAVLACGFYEHLDPLLDRLPEAKSATLEERLDGPAVKALRAYLDGDIDVFDSLSVRQPGSPFRQRVWNEMRKIRAGETISYSELARRACCAINLIAPIVPCHRVLRSDGTLGGYGYGIETKRWLLAHEGITS